MCAAQEYTGLSPKLKRASVIWQDRVKNNQFQPGENPCSPLFYNTLPNLSPSPAESITFCANKAGRTSVRSNTIGASTRNELTTTTRLLRDRPYEKVVLQALQGDQIHPHASTHPALTPIPPAPVGAPGGERGENRDDSVAFGKKIRFASPFPSPFGSLPSGIIRVRVRAGRPLWVVTQTIHCPPRPGIFVNIVTNGA